MTQDVDAGATKRPVVAAVTPCAVASVLVRPIVADVTPDGIANASERSAVAAVLLELLTVPQNVLL